MVDQGLVKLVSELRKCDEQFALVPGELLWVFNAQGQRGAAFVTKNSLCRRWQEDGTAPRDVVLFNCCVLMDIQAIEYILRCARAVSRTLIFVGDLDPLDLGIYGVFRRAAAEAGRVIWAALNDQWVRVHDETVEEKLKAYIRMSDAERAALKIVKKLIPDLRDVIGQRSYDLLDSGVKLELEGACAIGAHSRNIPTLLAAEVERLARLSVRRRVGRKRR